ncbi:hypothetical protein QMK19_38450 [Streptomyces sp. H10-C2]|uniref:hypothetical protein n=1 Tax=unclassified Streptomyces TaxID=2593676 RepID=UPI0024BA6A2B|nr:MULTISPECIES: hypothetical protein [unclassified Streptomyces]MDJ0346524.1 hypothetical protein [Streptomyces sp. PH10-H1]MDJ0375324.1 hypothetical protein [Streptomyces sp. H10-C2]
MQMHATTVKALREWKDAFDHTQEAAATAMRAAFPDLAPVPRPTGCCDVRLGFGKPGSGSGSGTVCIDLDGRSTIEFAGAYSYDCDSTSAEYEVVMGTEGTGALYVAYVQVPDAAGVLDALTQAFEERQESAGAT